MADWMWITLYVLGWVVVGAGIARTLLAAFADPGYPLEGDDYAFAIWFGWIMGGAFWPLALVIGALYLGIKRGKGLFSFIIPTVEKQRIAKVKAREQEAELKELRRQMEELKLKGGDLL